MQRFPGRIHPMLDVLPRRCLKKPVYCGGRIQNDQLTYIGNTGFNFPVGKFVPGILALVTPDGSARQVADGLAFPNGVVVTPDDQYALVLNRRSGDMTVLGILPNRPNPAAMRTMIPTW